ncbi:MAG: ATP-binding protein [Litorimonas sp.]
MTKAEAIVIVCGAPGTGKSTLARELMTYWGRGATVEVDDLRGMINQIDWTSHQQHFDGIRAAVAVCEYYRRSGYQPLVLIDTFGYGSLEVATSELKDLPQYTVSLTSSDTAIKWRLIRRLGGYRDWRNAQKFNEHMRENAFKHDLTFDTSQHTVSEIAKRVVAFLETSR